MPIGRLEHTNISVTDPDRSAALLIDLLGWEERWREHRCSRITIDRTEVALAINQHVTQ